MDQHDIFIKNKLRKVCSFVKPQSKVLDVGCYNGRLLRFLPKVDYYGVDADEKLMSDLRKKGLNAKAVDLNHSKIPFEKEKFDYIFLLDILEHVANPRGLLKKLKKMIKPKGKFIITLPNDYNILNKIRFVLNKNLTEDPFEQYGHLHFFPIKSADILMKECGFKVLKKEVLAPTKPLFFSQSIKNFLSKLSPDNFARNVLYVAELR